MKPKRQRRTGVSTKQSVITPHKTFLIHTDCGFCRVAIEMYSDRCTTRPFCVEHNYLQEIPMDNEKPKFTIKDSGERQNFSSGMVRDTQEDKADFTRVLDGPMFDRWADHLTNGEKKYPDVEPGVPNWTLANGEAELTRFKKSAFRHFRQWLRGDRDEDHAAAVFFNVNGAEYVRDKLK